MYMYMCVYIYMYIYIYINTMHPAPIQGYAQSAYEEFPC